MKKAALIICLMLVFAVAVSAKDSSKPLCEFKFGEASGSRGGFFLQYDGRFYDESYTVQSSYPNGGIKFGFELGYYSSELLRDQDAAKVHYIEYTNLNNKSEYKLVTPAKYKISSTWVADYTLTFGSVSNAIGDWEIKVVHDFGTYKAEFSVTQAMIEAIAPLPVELWIDDSLNVCFNKTVGATSYRFRLFDGLNITTDIRIPPKSTDKLPADPICIPTDSGKSGRIEARLVSGKWISLITSSNPQVGCQNTWTNQKDSRACTSFIVED